MENPFEVVRDFQEFHFFKWFVSEHFSSFFKDLEHWQISPPVTPSVSQQIHVSNSLSLPPSPPKKR
jgi:hypothetical protein